MIHLSSNSAETSIVNEEGESQNYSTEDNNDSDESDEKDTLLVPPAKEKVVVARIKNQGSSD